MAAGQFFVLIVLAVAVFSGAWVLYQRSRPTERALRKARKGKIAEALAELEARLEKEGPSPELRGALGQVYLLDHRPHQAEAELRKALELGSRRSAHLNALGWALIRLGRLDEALPIAEEANQSAREDFEVYCLYCGLLAHHGRAAEVAPLFEFLKRTSAQIEKLRPRAYNGGLGEKFEFARAKMNAAGFT
jgi:tetratricopeptide (TPR) repeat protein